MKYFSESEFACKHCGRSRKGAWIEIALASAASLAIFVAPVRERGLKFYAPDLLSWQFRRSRKGAWIEIAQTP